MVVVGGDGLAVVVFVDGGLYALVVVFTVDDGLLNPGSKLLKVVEVLMPPVEVGAL